MRWTTRLKRYGSLASIVRFRVQQYNALKQRPSDAVDAKERRAMKDYLDGHPLRVISDLLEAP